MEAVVLIAALVVAAALIGWLLVYKERHPHTEGDLKKARKDARDRSHASVSGKVLEQMMPLLPEFCAEFNPRDARFIGSPIDLVVFDGLDEGEELRRVVLVEIKRGKGGLPPRERRVRDAIEAGRVEYKLFRLPGEAVSDDDGVPALETPEAPHALRQ